MSAIELALILYALRRLQKEMSSDLRCDMQASGLFADLASVPSAHDVDQILDRLCEQFNCGD